MAPAEATQAKPATPADIKAEAPKTLALDVQTTAYMQGQAVKDQPSDAKQKLEPKIPAEIPGADAKPIQLPKREEKEARQRAIKELYPELPPLPDAPTPLPGPEGRPYTLSSLQHIAAGNSPELKQAAADVETARGNLIQARAYPNPTVGYQVQPSNDGSTAGVQGPFVDQTIKFAGKLKLASAAAEMDLANADLALHRAQSDLATRVRNAYYAVLVAQETVRVNRSLARFTDEIYRLHAGLLEAGNVASYEPMALRAQAYTARLSYKQSIQNYIYSWKQLVATIGVRQLPLSEVAGRIDALMPYYDYDKVLTHALRNHTDVLTARNGVDKARYNLKLAQITPYPDLDVNVALLKEYALAPKQFVHTVTVGVPFPLWDQNKGNIMAAEGALVRATEEPHRVEENLTNTLATTYMGYKTNLEALQYYRKYILPDQVRAYRGVLDRRQIDPAVAFADLLGAQQTLAADVTNYLGILGSLWASVVSVADLLQTDDLFQLGEPRELPQLPDLNELPAWPCCHDCPPLASERQGACNSCASEKAAQKPVVSKAGQGPSTVVTHRGVTSTCVERDEMLPQPDYTSTVQPQTSNASPSADDSATLEPTSKMRQRRRFPPFVDENRMPPSADVESSNDSQVPRR
jgi:cobalt-zinc-cadmium efflux system outer membrane protein